MVKLDFERAKLGSALNFVKSSIPKKEIEPILNNFCFKVLDNTTVQIVSTDLDLMAVVKCPCTVEGEASDFTLPGEKFLSLMNKLGGERITLTCDDSVIINCGNYKGDFKTLGTEDYPPIYEITKKDDFKSFKREDLLAGLKRVAFAVNDDEARKQLMAVQISRKGMVASTGKITAIYKEAFDVDELCISSNCLKDLISVMEASTAEEMHVFEEEAYLVFKFGDNLFFTRKTSVKFPEVFNKIEKPTQKNSEILRFKVKDLIATLRRISLTASEETCSIYFDMMSPEEMKVSSRDTKDFSSEETIKFSSEGINFSPETPFQLIFNYNHLLEILSKMAGEEIELRMNSENVRMPIRVEEGKTIILFMRSLT